MNHFAQERRTSPVLAKRDTLCAIIEMSWHGYLYTTIVHNGKRLTLNTDKAAKILLLQSAIS